MMTNTHMQNNSVTAVPSTDSCVRLNNAGVSQLSAPMPSSAVLRGQKSVSIEHQGVIYRLAVTKLGKLILTK